MRRCDLENKKSGRCPNEADVVMRVAMMLTATSHKEVKVFVCAEHHEQVEAIIDSRKDLLLIETIPVSKLKEVVDFT